MYRAAQTVQHSLVKTRHDLPVMSQCNTVFSTSSYKAVIMREIGPPPIRDAFSSHAQTKRRYLKLIVIKARGNQ
jgi:hypothetical protein